MTRPRVAATLLGALALTAALVQAALGPRYGGEVRLAVLDALPPAGPPLPAATASDRALLALVHETLVTVGDDGVPAPSLAAGWSVGAGGREWTLRLAPGAVFHDGQPVDAESALASLRRFAKSGSPSSASFAGLVDTMTSPRPGEVVLRLKRPGSPLWALTALDAAITSPAGAGAGPFVPTVELPRERGLVAFGAHVRGRPFLDSVRVLAMADQKEVSSALAAGAADVAPSTGAPAEASALASTLLLVLDPRQAPFDREEARQAVSAAIDRAALVRTLLPGGEGAPILLAPSVLPPLPAEAGAHGGSLAGRVRLTVARDVPAVVSQRVVAHLVDLGLAVDVTDTPAAAARTSGSALRLFLWTPQVPEPELALRELMAWHSTPAAAEALAAASAETSADRRRALLLRAESALRKDAVLVPLATVPVAFQVRRGVFGASVDRAGRLRLENAWVQP